MTGCRQEIWMLVCKDHNWWFFYAAFQLCSVLTSVPISHPSVQILDCKRASSHFQEGESRHLETSRRFVDSSSVQVLGWWWSGVSACIVFIRPFVMRPPSHRRLGTHSWCLTSNYQQPHQLCAACRQRSYPIEISFNASKLHRLRKVNLTVKVLISQNVFHFETLSVFTEGVTSYSARAADVDGTKTISHLTEFLSSHSRFVRRLKTGAWTLAVTTSRNIPKRRDLCDGCTDNLHQDNGSTGLENGAVLSPAILMSEWMKGRIFLPQLSTKCKIILNAEWQWWLNFESEITKWWPSILSVKRIMDELSATCCTESLKTSSTALMVGYWWNAPEYQKYCEISRKMLEESASSVIQLDFIRF